MKKIVEVTKVEITVKNTRGEKRRMERYMRKCEEMKKAGGRK